MIAVHLVSEGCFGLVSGLVSAVAVAGFVVALAMAPAVEVSCPGLRLSFLACHVGHEG